MKNKLALIKVFIIESLIGKIILGVVALTLVVWGALALWNKGTDIGTKQAAEQVVQFSKNIRRYYQNRPDFWGLDSKAAIDKKIAPLAMVKPEGLNHFFGGVAVVGNGIEGTMLMPGARTFDIAFKELNKKQCTELASYKFSEDFWMSLSSIVVLNGFSAKEFSWNGTENKLPISEGKAKEVCGSDSAILWHFE